MKHPVMHFEIMGHDAGKLRDFYADVFDWSVGKPLPGTPEYSIVEPVPNFQHGISGGIGKAPEGYDGHVTFYIVVDDVERAFAKIEAKGGTRMMGPDKVPNGPIIGLFRDPDGRTIGLVNPSDDDMRNSPMDLTPFVFFYGRCAEALEFYKKALGGSYEIGMQEGDAVHYATFTAPGIAFKASDGMARRPVDPDEGNVSLALNHPDATRAAEICDALADGGKIVTPFGDAQWGGKFGAVQDRFGTEWFVTAP